MKTRATLIRTLTTGFALATLAACGGGSDPNSPEFQAYEQRDAVMHEMGDAILVLNDMSREQIPVDDAAFREAAQQLAQSAERMLDGFENQTIVPESRAMPEIFENWDDFVSKTEDLQEAANELAMAAESGGFAAGRSLVEGARNTCGACHRVYRAPEED